jgi:signal transduction histidine kinase
VPGSGLGLSIVQRCVELHGGDIELQSPPRGGLSVVVNLPKFRVMQPARGVEIAAAAAI